MKTDGGKIEYPSESYFDFISVDSAGFMMKKAMAPNIGTVITTKAQITFGVDDKSLFAILISDIIDKMGQHISSKILTICKTIVIVLIISNFPLTNNYSF